MNKPDWKDAPEWANWLAQDADGSWWWYEEEPSTNEEAGVWFASGETRMASDPNQTGPKEQRPKPKVETREIIMPSKSFWDAPDGRRIDGPCTITITMTYTQGGGS